MPKAESQDPPTQSTIAPDPSVTASPAPQLIPPNVLLPPEPAAPPAPPLPNFPSIPQLDDAFKQNPLSVAAENARKHAEWRRLQNRVVNDATVKKALHKAETAPTDLEKRNLLRQYYEIYFGRMMALATTPEMKAYLDERKKERLNTLPQPRVRPEATRPGKPQS